MIRQPATARFSSRILLGAAVSGGDGATIRAVVVNVAGVAPRYICCLFHEEFGHDVRVKLLSVRHKGRVDAYRLHRALLIFSTEAPYALISTSVLFVAVALRQLDRLLLMMPTTIVMLVAWHLGCGVVADLAVGMLHGRFIRPLMLRGLVLDAMSLAVRASTQFALLV